jgi:PilX N-terminal
MTTRAAQDPNRHQRGAATLVVVMVLFFVMSMVAAYTSRNLIFEQKTASNQVRSTQAAEAAEAGMQWALGLLNSGRIDTTCVPSVAPANTTFRQRYLSIDGTNGNVTPVTKVPSGLPLTPSCVFNGLNWNCSCPVNGDPGPAIPVSGAVLPAYRVRFTPHPDPNRQMMVKLEVVGCTLYSDNCLKFDGAGADNEGRAYASAYITLKGALTSTPAAPVTARATLNLGGAALSIYNTNPKSSGITVNSGGAAVTTGLDLHTIAGSPKAPSVVDNDLTLVYGGFAAAERPDAMFVATFGMAKNTYRDQPGTVILNCGGTCNTAQIQTAVANNPGRIIWANGPVVFDAGGAVGSLTEPIALVSTGDVQFSAAATEVFGLIYSQSASWLTAGAGKLQGAAIGEGAIAGNATTTIAYDSGILDRLRYATGSFVVVPGTWKDF